MTNQAEKPCLSLCWFLSGALKWIHGPGCPNEPAKPAEPHKCENPSECYDCLRGFASEDFCDRQSDPTPPQGEPPLPTCLPDCKHTPRDWGHSESGAPTPPPPVKPEHMTTLGEALAKARPVEPGSEPPIEVTDGLLDRINVNIGGRAYRAVFALKSERDALAAKVEKQDKLIAEIAEATRRVNLAAFDLYSDILPAVKALEGILRRQKEQNNG